MLGPWFTHETCHNALPSPCPPSPWPHRPLSVPSGRGAHSAFPSVSRIAGGRGEGPRKGQKSGPCSGDAGDAPLLPGLRGPEVRWQQLPQRQGCETQTLEAPLDCSHLGPSTLLRGRGSSCQLLWVWTPRGPGIDSEEPPTVLSCLHKRLVPRWVWGIFIVGLGGICILTSPSHKAPGEIPGRSGASPDMS